MKKRIEISGCYGSVIHVIGNPSIGIYGAVILIDEVKTPIVCAVEVRDGYHWATISEHPEGVLVQCVKPFGLQYLRPL